MILYSGALNLIEGCVISHINPAVNISITTSTLCSDTAPQSLRFISEITTSFTFQIAVLTSEYRVECFTGFTVAVSVVRFVITTVII